MREQIKRYLLFLLGLYVNSLGIAFITRADLGTSPISSVPYTLSLGFSPTLGMFTLYMSLVLVLLQVLLLRKTFPLIWVLQIPFSFLFFCFIDLSMDMLSFLQTDAYLLKLLYLLIGCGICLSGNGGKRGDASRRGVRVRGFSGVPHRFRQDESCV